MKIRFEEKGALCIYNLKLKFFQKLFFVIKETHSRMSFFNHLKKAPLFNAQLAGLLDTALNTSKK